MACSMPGLPVPYYVPEFAQVHVHWVGDAIQPLEVIQAKKKEDILNIWDRATKPQRRERACWGSELANQSFGLKQKRRICAWRREGPAKSCQGQPGPDCRLHAAKSEPGGRSDNWVHGLWSPAVLWSTAVPLVLAGRTAGWGGRGSGGYACPEPAFPCSWSWNFKIPLQTSPNLLPASAVFLLSPSPREGTLLLVGTSSPFSELCLRCNSFQGMWMKFWWEDWGVHTGAWWSPLMYEVEPGRREKDHGLWAQDLPSSGAS